MRRSKSVRVDCCGWRSGPVTNSESVMAYIFEEVSRTFGEYLLVPNLTPKSCVAAGVSLVAPVVRFQTEPGANLPSGSLSNLTINIPIASALMQSVSGVDLAISLARCGGISFIFSSQAIADQVEMVRRVKNYKAGFVVSDSNLPTTARLRDVLEITRRTGHSTVAITECGSAHGKLVGMITPRDFRESRDPADTAVRELFTPVENLCVGHLGISLEAANDLIWRHKLDWLPILDGEGRLDSVVFRKDYESHKAYPLENVDSAKRLIVGAGINTRDYEERVPALLQAGADVLCIDSSDGFSEWQGEAIKFIRKNHPEAYVGAGNVVDRDGFNYLADAGADFIKVGIGGGSICITREQKGIGRGQATSVLDVVKARNEFFHRTGTYIPICSDGGISQDYHVTLALAMGADFVMMGRYFARFEESAGKKVVVNGHVAKEYWGEGSSRARNWQRYADGVDGDGDKKGMEFEEGVDSYVPYAGRLAENLLTTLSKIRSTMCNSGATNLRNFADTARLTLVSASSIKEGSAHDVIVKEVRSGSVDE